VQQEAERQLKTGGLDLKILNNYILQQKKRIPELDGLRMADSAGYLICGDRVVREARVPFGDREVFIVICGGYYRCQRTEITQIEEFDYGPH